MVNGQYKWHSIASLLNINDWKYYKGVYYNTNCTSCNAGCFNGSDGNVHYFWLPMSKFSDANNKADVDVSNLLSDLANNPSSVPKVCWIVPGNAVSEHMGQSNDVRKGQAYVTTIVKAIMSSSIWNNCAIFISWDDWGGHYDHAIPPFQSIQDNEGWGLRVPGLMLSPYAKKSGGTKKGWVDHEWYSHDAYLKLIEDLFCNSNRIGYGDGRPQQRESLQQLGDLLNEFDFNQTPRTNTTQFRNLMKCKTY